MRTLGYLLALVLLLTAAWGTARMLVPEAPAPTAAKALPADPYTAALKDLPATPTAVQLRVAVNVAFGLMLTDDDIRAWRAWTAEGISPGEALRRVVAYRRAADSP